MTEYLLDSFDKPDHLVTSTLVKYSPTLIGKSWRYLNGVIYEFDDNWCDAHDITLELVQERIKAIEIYHKNFLVAIALTKLELKNGV